MTLKEFGNVSVEKSNDLLGEIKTVFREYTNRYMKKADYVVE